MEQMHGFHLTIEFHIPDHTVLKIQNTCLHCFYRFLLFLKKIKYSKNLKCPFPDHKTSLQADRYARHQNNVEEPSKKTALGESSTLAFVTPML